MAMAVLRTAIFPLAAAGPGRNSLLGPPCCLLLPAGPSTQGIPGPAGWEHTHPQQDAPVFPKFHMILGRLRRFLRTAVRLLGA
jgi:hypothetical protein